MTEHEALDEIRFVRHVHEYVKRAYKDAAMFEQHGVVMLLAHVMNECVRHERELRRYVAANEKNLDKHEKNGI